MTAVLENVAPPAESVRPERPDRPWRRAWRAGLGTWALAVAAYLVLNTTFWSVATRPSPSAGNFLGVWNRWDTGHYLYISTYGYNPATENPAFFPLYPLLMAAFDPVLPGGRFGAALVISSVACIVALSVLYRLVDDLFDPGTAERTAFFLMASPFAFYLVAAYNESLLLALCVGSLYCMRRGNWWLAGALAGLASATRQAGLLLAVAFVIEYVRQRWQARQDSGSDGGGRWLRWNALAILLVPTGLIAFMIYSAVELGDPLRFMHIQSFWGRTLSPPWTGTVGEIDYIRSVWHDGPFSGYVVFGYIDLATLPVLLTLLVLAVTGPWRLGRESWYLIAFGAAVLVMVVLSPLGAGLAPLHGLPRYALEIVPIFVVLARMGRNRIFGRAYLVPALAGQAAMIVGFFGGEWLS